MFNRSAPVRKTETAKVTGTRDVVASQLRHLQTKNDKLNEELAEVMKQDSGMRAGLKKLEATPGANPHQLSTIKEQLTSLALRKENLLKMIGLIEADIVVKEKEMSKVK